MARILRGEIYWADLNPTRGSEQAGERPILVISHEIFNERSGTVIALPITSRPQRVSLPLAMKIESVKLPKPSWLKISQIRTISTERLGKRLGRIRPEELDQVIEAFFELVV